MHREHFGFSNNPSGSGSPRRGNDLEQLRQRAQHQAQTAHDAITRALAAGAPEQQLTGLRNTSGQ